MKLIIDISEEEYKSILSYVQVYNSHYADMIRNGKPYEEKPKGEWTITKEGYVECPFCKCEREIPENYCGYCGADMRV